MCPGHSLSIADDQRACFSISAAEENIVQSCDPHFCLSGQVTIWVEGQIRGKVVSGGPYAGLLWLSLGSPQFSIISNTVPGQSLPACGPIPASVAPHSKGGKVRCF
jgi:hypothetical protein